MPFDISAQIESWRCQLLDTSKRNRLINFKTGKTGGISLVSPAPGDLWERLVLTNTPLAFVWKRDLIDLPPDAEEADGVGALALSDTNQATAKEHGPDVLDKCLRSPRLRPSHLLTNLTDSRLATRLTRFALNSRESLTEQGVATLYVAFGYLRWFEAPSSQVEVRSPLLLIAVRLERDTVESPWKLLAEDEEILTNYTLAQLLEKEFRLRLPLPKDEASDEADPTWRTRYFAEVQRCVHSQDPRWEVLDEVGLGTFSFQKLAMWDDLGRNCERIAGHDLCRAVAGDPTVQMGCPPDLPTAKELDRLALPDQTFHILDADSSQHAAIEAAKRGASLVLDGPPGTGKSQTIANIVAEFLAAGKTVLFVSEKAAALEVVQRRLQDKGLGDFCLDCHSHKANKREMVAELGRCLALGPESHRDPAEGLQRLHEIRSQLNEYVRQLHATRTPLGKTIYQVHGELARLERLSGRSGCSVPQVLDRDAAYLRHVAELLARLPDCRNVIANRECHPWRGCRASVYSLTMRDDVRHHFGRLAEYLVGVEKAVLDLHELSFSPANPTWLQWQAAVETVRIVLACPAIPAEWFTSDPRPVAEAFVQIHKLSQEYRQRVALLPEFAPEALRATDAKIQLTLTMSPGDFELVQRPGDSVKSLLQRLKAVGGSLTDLLPLAKSLDQAARKVGELLLDSFPRQPIKNLRSLAKLAGKLARTGTIRHSWWGAERRKELQEAIARYQEVALAAQEARAELASRLAPRAFEPESAELMIRADQYKSFLARLLPSWWSLKGTMSGWYVGAVPRTGPMLEDMRKLAAYHQRIDFGRQVRSHYAADLLPGQDGEPNWAQTLEALQSIDRLEQMTKIPAAIRSALCLEEGLNRRALASAGQELAEQVTDLRQQLELLTREYDLVDGTDGKSWQDKLTPPDLVEWLVKHSNSANKQATGLEQIVGLLADGQDVAVQSLPDRLYCLAELGKLRAGVTGEQEFDLLSIAQKAKCFHQRGQAVDGK